MYTHVSSNKVKRSIIASAFITLAHFKRDDRTAQKWIQSGYVYHQRQQGSYVQKCNFLLLAAFGYTNLNVGRNIDIESGACRRKYRLHSNRTFYLFSNIIQYKTVLYRCVCVCVRAMVYLTLYETYYVITFLLIVSFRTVT